MTELLATYAVLSLLVSIVAFLLGRWSISRKFKNVTERLDELRTASRASEADRWARLWDRMDQVQAAPQVNLTGVTDRLDALAYAVTKLDRPQASRSPDLGPIQSGLSAIRRDVEFLRRNTDGKRMELMPLQAQVKSLDRRLNDFPRSLNVARLDRRLEAIEIEMKLLRRGAGGKMTDGPTGSPGEYGETGKFLSRAIYGDRDELSRISGVGPKLTQLLNENGIYYFWQIASWDDRDIAAIENRLETFRGRIRRDGWISQASRLSEAPGAAGRPAELAKTA